MNKFFNNASIRKKLLVSHIVLIAIPSIVVVIFFYSRIYNLIVNDSIRQEQALAHQTAMTVSSTLDQIVTISNAIGSNPYLNSVIQYVEDGKPQTEGTVYSGGSSDTLTVTQTFNEAIEAQLQHTPVTAVRFYSDAFPKELCNDPVVGQYFYPMSEAKGSYWYGIFSSTSKYSIYCPSFYLTDAEISDCGDLAYMRKIFLNNDDSASSACYLAVYYPSSSLNNILSGSISINNSVSYILNERNSIAASSNKALSGTYLMDYDTVTDIGKIVEGYTTRTVLDKDVYASSYQISGSDWYMVSILPAEPVLSKGKNIINSFALLYLLLLALAFIIATHLSNSITKRLDTIGSQMRMVRSGPPILLPAPKIHDEIGDLTDNYNYMTDKMNLLIENQEKAAEELRISEIRALQAQINPHFLYNTMEMINWLSQSGQQGEVTTAIQALSRFYKLTLSKKGIFGTIASETEHVTLYVQLQNMRYNNMIHFVADIPEELADCRIPKLTFQPVVENSILHGILEKESGEGTIVITGWSEGSDLVIQISDDGVGIPPDKIENILSGNSTPEGNGTNIAIVNTHRRLQTIYGPDYGLSYSSIFGSGTTVEIRIPQS